MNTQQFETLVEKLEHQALEKPERYKLKVFLLALLGNVYVGVVLSLLIGLLSVSIALLMALKFVALKLIVPIGFFLWTILKALWLKMEPPEGIEITEHQAPELFAMIHELQHRLNAPRFHHVLITDEFNAGVIQTPRLGIFGWPRNYLQIGLPLMKVLSIEQFKAVLAHEFGHLAKGHGRMSNWIYYQRLRWSRLLTTLESNESKGSFLFKPFLNWFSPYFNAYSFPLARANEFDADATSIKLTSARTAAEALTNVNVLGHYLAEKYWPSIYKEAENSPQPNFLPYRSMGQSIRTEVDEQSAQNWLSQAMLRKTDTTDTHPALHDRLAAIKETARFTMPKPEETADQLLGTLSIALSETFDQQWHHRISSSWETHHEEVQQERRQLAELNEHIEAGRPLPFTDLYHRAILTERVGGNPEEALKQLQTLYDEGPEHVSVCLALGSRLLDRDESKAHALLEQTIRLNESYAATCYELLYLHHKKKENKGEAHDYHERLVQAIQVEQAANKERTYVYKTDKLEPHNLPEDEVHTLRVTLQQIQGLQKAYLVKKTVKHWPQFPCYFLGYTCSKWYQLHSKKREQAVLRQIKERGFFLEGLRIFSLEGDHSHFRRKFARLKNSRVF